MAYAVADVSSTWPLPLWVAGVVVLGIVLGYAIHRAGYLRRGERERLDRTTHAVRQADERSEMERAEEPLETERAPPLVDLQRQVPAASPQEDIAAASPQEDVAAASPQEDAAAPSPQQGPQPRPGARKTKRRRRRR